MLAVVKKNPATQANLSKSEFVYDGGSRLRISREYTWDDSAWVLLPNSEKRGIYNGMDVIQERDAANDVIATYTRDGNIGGILAKRDGNEDDFFFHYDGSGNVVALTDEDQNSVAEYAYDAYGNLLSASGAQASNNLYRYSTKEYFAHAGLYSYGLRFYSSGLGRWINRDPIAEVGGLNLYGFVGNSPANAVDAYGLMGVVFGGPNSPIAIKWGDPTFILDYNDMVEGFYAQKDFFNILGDPNADAGIYNPCDPIFIGTRVFSAIGGGAGLTALGVAASPYVAPILGLGGAGAGPATQQIAQVRINNAAGRTAEALAARDLIAEGNTILGSQVAARTSAGLRYIDHLIQTPTGQVVAIEVKSGNAIRNTSQLLKDGLMASEGAIIIGRNAPATMRGGQYVIQTLERRY